MKVVTFKMPEDLLEKLDNLALERFMTRSEVIRRAVQQYIESEVRVIKTRRLRIYW